MKIKKGDTVKIIAGNSKGKTGKVLQVLPKENKVVVEGIAVVSRHTKPSNAHPDGGIIKKKRPLIFPMSNTLIPKGMCQPRLDISLLMAKSKSRQKTGNVLDK